MICTASDFVGVGDRVGMECNLLYCPKSRQVITFATVRANEFRAVAADYDKPAS